MKKTSLAAGIFVALVAAIAAIFGLGYLAASAFGELALLIVPAPLLAMGSWALADSLLSKTATDPCDTIKG